MTSQYRPALRVLYRTARGKSFQCNGFAVRSYATRTYDDALTHLNTLQTSHKVLAEKRAAGFRPDDTVIQDMIKYLSMIGHSVSDLDKLNVVHVAGTKGKGTTCAYVDSILAQYRKKYNFPKKVGLYTSPHLVDVRERIRINSTPISPEMFAKYFFEVWDLLTMKYKLATLRGELKDLPVDEKPGYFKFLTLMSFHVFLQEGINVAIYETGIGGKFDSTNIVEHPACTGITKLDLDHTFTLGETIDEIASQKAGIQKTGSPSFYVNQAPHATASEVIKQRAKELNVNLTCVAQNNHFSSRRIDDVNIKPNIHTQRSNANLAVSLAQTVLGKIITDSIRLTHRSMEEIQPQKLSREFIDGLEQAVLPGKYDIREEGPITWYLDGAHTDLSMKAVVDWYKDEFKNRWSNLVEGGKAPALRVLIFNQQGDRDAMKLLKCLHSRANPFQHVIFCPSASQIHGTFQKEFVNHMHDKDAIASLSFQHLLADGWKTMYGKQSEIVVLPGVTDAIEFVRKLVIVPEDAIIKNCQCYSPEHLRHWVNPKTTERQPSETSLEWRSDWEQKGRKLSIHVLVTGSIHLVGRALAVLENQSVVEN